MKCNSENASKCQRLQWIPVGFSSSYFLLCTVTLPYIWTSLCLSALQCQATVEQWHTTLSLGSDTLWSVYCVFLFSVCVCQTPPQHVAPSRTGSHISFFFCVFPHSTVHPDQPVNHRRYNIDTTNNNGLCSGIKQKPCLLLSDFTVCCLKPGTKWECGPVQNHSLRSDPQVKSNVFSESRQDTDYITWIKSQFA